MTLVAAATAALVAAAAPEPILLQALTPTSGDNAAALLDGKLETGWTPSGDPRSDGVLFRFEKSVALDTIEVQACPGTGVTQLTPAWNGAMTGSITFKPGVPATLSAPGAPNSAIRSIFFRLDAGPACLAEVTFKRKDQRLDVRAPRSVPGTISASSILTPKDAYHPAYLFDGRLDFGWVEGADGPGAGQGITVTFDQPVTVNAIELWNGYQRSKDHFKKNARAKRIAVGTGEPPAATLNLADKMGEQKLALPAPITGTTFTLKILDAIKGSAYQDLVLSELRFWDASGPFTLATTDLSQRTAALRKSLSGTPLGEVTDRHLSGACPAGYDRRELKLRTNNTFVWYEDLASSEEQSTSEVFDGVWVTRTQASPWSELELFGRRHRVETTWAPYQEESEATTDRIAGGKIEVARVADLGADAFWKLMKEWRAKAAKDRVDCLFQGKPEDQLKQLVSRGAVVVRGAALTDVLWSLPR
jgi:hypothetical protein